ncbi:MAG: patatin-like phospholipase family protein [Pseudohongiellaceae bacterium]
MSEEHSPQARSPNDTRGGVQPAEQSATLSLVLGSGGARGLAHIGVIRELEQRGYHIDAIAGCSMGALVGGLYAVGKLEDYADWVCGLDGSDILGLLDITGARGGFIAGNKVMKVLHEWIGDTRIESLSIEFTAVAVDIEREREVWLNDGPLYDAIRASISIPGVFTPYRYRGRVLVDGGLLNPIPVAPTVHALTDFTFVVDANGPPTDLLPWRGEEKRSDNDDDGWFRTAARKLGWHTDDKAGISEEPDAINILMRSLDTMQAAITRQHLAVFNPDHVFRVPRNLCMIHEFHRAREVIEAGQEIAKEALDCFEEQRAGRSSQPE